MRISLWARPTRAPDRLSVIAWNSAYLDRLSAAVSRASSSCVTSEVKLFDKSILQNHWRDVPWAADNSSNGIELPRCTEPNAWAPAFYYLQQSPPNLQLSQQCYFDKIVDATKASTNVVYEIENENPELGSEPWARAWAQRLKLAGAPMPTQVPGRFCMGPDDAIFQDAHAPAPRDYLCYYDGTDGSVVKTIEGIAGPAAYSARWWDPRNGGFTGPSIELECVTDHSVTLSAPDSADWVLLLRKARDC